MTHFWRQRLVFIALAICSSSAPVAAAIESPGKLQPDGAIEDGAAATSKLEQIVALRLAGRLEAAEAGVLELLRQSPPSLEEIRLRLELARIYDRVGLHQNTRPVARALAEIERAQAVLDSPEVGIRADLALAFGKYYYRAEMAEGEFAEATRHLTNAISFYQQAKDSNGEADAVHGLGLVHFQRRELQPARELFDRSLVLDRLDGERPILRADFERHVAFVEFVQGKLEQALPYFERSLAYRQAASAHDASLFAANSLASILVDLGRFDDAQAPLLYATWMAEALDSPMGQVRNGWVAARLYEATGDPASAVLILERTLQQAKRIGSASLAERLRQSLDRLKSLEESSGESSKTPSTP